MKKIYRSSTRSSRSRVTFRSFTYVSMHSPSCTKKKKKQQTTKLRISIPIRHVLKKPRPKPTRLGRVDREKKYYNGKNDKNRNHKTSANLVSMIHWFCYKFSSCSHVLFIRNDATFNFCLWLRYTTLVHPESHFMIQCTLTLVLAREFDDRRWIRVS